MLKYKYLLLNILSVGVEMTKNQTKVFLLIGVILFSILCQAATVHMSCQQISR